jgi:hypothetical protein
MRILSHFWAFFGGLSLLFTEPVISFGYPDGSQEAFTPPNSNLSLISNIRGVNLGGWLVLEVRQNYLTFTMKFH